MIWREFDGLFEMGDPESVVELALPYPAVESLANLFLALQYAPRSVKGDNLATLPLAQITSTSETGLSIRILDYPDKKHSDFEFAIINDPSSNLGISIRADKRVPPMMKAAVLALEHLPIPSKWRPKLEIDHSQVVITGLGMRTNLYEPSSTGVSQITYELIKSQADKLTKLFVKKRPGFRIDFIAQPHSTEKIIFVIQTDGIFSTIRIDISNDQCFPLGLQISTQVFVNEAIKFASNPHRAVVTERLVLAMDSLLPVLLAQQFSSEKYPNPKLALTDEGITIG